MEDKQLGIIMRNLILLHVNNKGADPTWGVGGGGGGN